MRRHCSCSPWHCTPQARCWCCCPQCPGWCWPPAPRGTSPCPLPGSSSAACHSRATEACYWRWLLFLERFITLTASLVFFHLNSPLWLSVCGSSWYSLLSSSRKSRFPSASLDSMSRTNWGIGVTESELLGWTVPSWHEHIETSRNKPRAILTILNWCLISFTENSYRCRILCEPLITQLPGQGNLPRTDT